MFFYMVSKMGSMRRTENMMDREKILEEIQAAEMVLVGLGEDFNGARQLSQRQEYQRGKELLKEAGFQWLFPAWTHYCDGKFGDEKPKAALEKLAGLLKEKNYFVVSVSTNPQLTEIPWKQGRLVMPCGNILTKQCVMGEHGELEALTDEDYAALKEIFDALLRGEFPQNGISGLGKCRQCGRDMILNTIYAESYNETGYVEEWQTYTKWLQGTLNRRLLVLELGVGMQFPSVIRWPFEKVAYFNNKASFVRVNERLYQLTAELASKGVGIAQNAIEWINQL